MSKADQDRYLQVWADGGGMFFENDETGSVKTKLVKGRVHLIRARTKFATNFWLGFEGLEPSGGKPSQGSIAYDLYRAGQRAKKEAEELGYLLSVHRSV